MTVQYVMRDRATNRDIKTERYKDIDIDSETERRRHREAGDSMVSAETDLMAHVCVASCRASRNMRVRTQHMLHRKKNTWADEPVQMQ